ncbi:MAG: hypothetical protein R3F50_17445 [Gammaproteobacteria bacterium]
MKHQLKVLAMTALLISQSPFTAADVVVEQHDDNTGGKMVGGITAFLIGGLAGPAGSLLAILPGSWIGKNVQQDLGLSGQAYTVEKANGERIKLRSPNHKFEIGDKVHIEGIRPKPVTVYP